MIAKSSLGARILEKKIAFLSWKADFLKCFSLLCSKIYQVLLALALSVKSLAKLLLGKIGNRLDSVMGNICVSRGRNGGGLAQAHSENNLIRNPSFAKTQNQLILANGGDSGLVLGAEDNVELSQDKGKSHFTVDAGSTTTSSTRPHVVLVPHQHTLFCERKVCIIFQLSSWSVDSYRTLCG